MSPQIHHRDPVASYREVLESRSGVEGLGVERGRERYLGGGKMEESFKGRKGSGT